MTVMMTTKKKTIEQLEADKREADSTYQNCRIVDKMYAEQATTALMQLVRLEELRARLAKLAAGKSTDPREAHDLLLLARRHRMRAMVARTWLAEKTEL